MSSETCRLCGKINTSNINVFNDDNEMNLSKKIFLCFGLQIKECDTITTNVCKSCYYFTNTVYEFRLNCLEYNKKLKPEDKQVINYPSSEISQDLFLNSLLLKSKQCIQTKNRSIEKLLRKYPRIVLPKKCLEMDLDPVVLIESPSRNTKENSVEDIDEQENVETNEEAEEKPSLELKPKKKRKYPNWSCSKKKIKKMKLPKLSSVSLNIVSDKKDDRSILKNLLKGDEILTKNLSNSDDETVDNLNVENSNPSVMNGLKETESNLLVAVGEEVTTFICQTCNKIFDSQQSLNNHKKFHHKSTMLRCSKCLDCFTVVEEYMKHDLSCQSEKPNDTPQIDEFCKTRTNLFAQARKKTSASQVTVNEYVISSDDDVEIVDVSNTTGTEPKSTEVLLINDSDAEESIKNSDEVAPTSKITDVSSVKLENTETSVIPKKIDEISFINYIFKKCSYLERSGLNQKWLLKNIQKFTKNTYLPIQLKESENDVVSVEYTMAKLDDKFNKDVYWKVKTVIDLPESCRPGAPTKMVVPYNAVKYIHRRDQLTMNNQPGQQVLTLLTPNMFLSNSSPVSPEQPIILNGLSYPNITKICSGSSQNLTSSQELVSSTVSQPVDSNSSSILPDILESSSDFTVSTTKPLIRIKSLSELKDTDDFIQTS